MELKPADSTPLQDDGGAPSAELAADLRRNPRRWDVTIIGFGVTLAMLIVGAILGYMNTVRLIENNRRVFATQEIISELNNLLSLLKDAETGQRGYLLTEEPKYLEPYDDSVGKVQAEIVHLRTLIQEDAEQKRRLLVVEQDVTKKLAELQETINLIDAGDRAAALQVVDSDRGIALMGKVRDSIAAMQLSEHERLRRRGQESEASFRTAIATILLSTLLGSALVCTVYYLLQRNLRQKAKAAAILAEQKERLRITLASIGDAVISTDAAGNVTYLNTIAEKLTRWTDADAIGQPLTTVFHIVNETTRQVVENPALKALREGIIVGLANHTILIAKDGAEHFIDDSAAPIRDRHGEIAGSVLIFRDITERRQSELALEEKRRLLQLGAEVGAVLTQGDSLPNMLQGCTESLVANLDAALARIWTLNEAEQILELQASAGLYTHINGGHARIPVGKFKIGLIAEEKTPHLTNSVIGDPRVPEQEWAQREGLVAFAGYPLIVADRLVGVMGIFARQALSERTLAAMESVSKEIALGLLNRQVMQEEREHRELLRITLASIGDAVISTDAEGLVTFLNPVAAALTGWSQQEAIGRSLTEVFSIINESTRQPVENPAERALREGKIVGLANHTVLIAKEGTERFIDDSAAPIRDAANKIVGAVLVFRDISERKEIENESRQHEERYRTLFNTIDEGFCVVEMIFDDAGKPIDYQFLELNPAFEKQTGLVNAAGKRMRELAPDHEEKWFEIYGQVAVTGDSTRFVHQAKALDGRWFDVYAFRVGSESSQRVALLFTDITQRRQTEQDRRDSEERFRTLVEQVQDYAIFMTDPQGRATSWNEGVQRVLGFDESEFIGQDIVSLIFTPEDVVSGIAQAELDQAAAVGSASDDRWMLRKDGTRFWAAGVTTGLLDEDEKLLGFMKVMRDQTERKRLEDELRQVAADLSESDRRKTEFLATLGHELRNPLAPIRTGLEVMKVVKDNPELIENVRSTMERQTQQMVRLIDDLLDVSRITRGRIELRTSQITLGEIIRSAVEATQPFVDEAGHTLQVTLPESPILLDADPNRLAQVFSNLLNNSSKYTPDGGHIWLMAQCENGEVAVTIKDDGLGIPLDQQSQIFEMFAQIDRPLEKGYTGLGIGLTLVKQLVELHGGTIDVQSDGPDQGSEFCVRLPIAGEPKRATPAELTVTPQPIKLRVLIVDDNKAAATMLKMVVKMLGNEVMTAHDGVQAIATAAEFSPDIVLMDLGMPKMNGYEAAREIRRQPWGQKMVLVALTGWGQDEDRQRTADAGFNHHLVKPAEPSDLQQLFATVHPSNS
ncbi:PAS domain S-box protein [Blastopirellula sp. J2-11]|uniref:PAS domain S-box protein n=1 Tax=Blastopirellula sp. J2-11 TaxID=2943192 RepID=UPI0021C99F9B|nr:PAS domain S-box protein [Blastopirellula sp. J2-11]UUO08399.1 PAS domain S-box protein [Blastopirellula sp. J2-11]